jgi:hydrogenase nickel incorporation protein HypB
MLRDAMNAAIINSERAEENRTFLRNSQIAALNLVGLVGCGKTTLITETLRHLQGRLRVAVTLDGPAGRYGSGYRKTEARFLSVQTDPTNASWFGRLLSSGQLTDTDLVLIEQTAAASRGCIELGQSGCVAVFSVAAGDQAVARCPLLIECAKLIVLTKSDLLPGVRFDRQAFDDQVRRLNPSVDVLEVSSSTGLGFDRWIEWLCREVTTAKQSIPVSELSASLDAAAHMLPPGFLTLDRSRSSI